MAEQSLFFFTGPNTFALREEKRKWKEQFIAKHGEENLLTLLGSQLTFRTLADEAGAAPFIGLKRLVFVEGIPKYDKEEMEQLPSILHPSTVLVFSDPQPDKRLSGTKVLLKMATVKEFTPLSRPALRTWMREYLRARNASLDSAGEELLFSIVGEDQEVIASELDKLSSSTRASSLTAADVQALAVPWGEQEIWALTRLIAANDTQGALRYAAAMMRQGEDAHSLWNMLLWMARNMVSVGIAVREQGRQATQAALRLGVPMPTLRTILPAMHDVSIPALHELVDWAARADIALKTGGYRATADATEELVSLIEQLIARMVNALRPTVAAR